MRHEILDLLTLRTWLTWFAFTSIFVMGLFVWQFWRVIRSQGLRAAFAMCGGAVTVLMNVVIYSGLATSAGILIIAWVRTLRIT